MTRPTGLVAVHHDGCAVVDVLDHVGDVGDEVVGAHDQRVVIHQRAARRRQRDHPARDVAVERRGDDRGAALTRQREDVRLGRGAVAEHEQRDADVDRDPLRVGPVADHDHVARLEPERQRRGSHREHPHAAAHLVVGRALEHLALEHLGDHADRRRRVQARRLARLAHVPARQDPLGHHAREPFLVVDHRHEVEVPARHDQADLADRLVVPGEREALAHDVQHAQHHVRQQLRLGGAAALEHPARLRVELAEPHRHVVVARVEPALQLGIADRRRDRIRVGIAMPGDVDGGHRRT